MKIFEGSSIETDVEVDTASPEQLKSALAEAQSFVDLFRQQRDKMGSVANDLQATLSLAQHKIKVLEEQVAQLKGEYPRAAE